MSQQTPNTNTNNWASDAQRGKPIAKLDCDEIKWMLMLRHCILLNMSNARLDLPHG